MGKTLIRLNNVFKAFGELVVLDGVNLTIEEGLVTTIIGRSGRGQVGAAQTHYRPARPGTVARFSIKTPL